MTQFVAYTRVSTEQQGIDGNGMAAQEAAISRHVDHADRELLETFKEVESGKKCARPQLDAAIAYALKHKATLLIAKLDRLSRSVAFIAKLMETRVEFVCCDMPEAGPLVLHVMAAFAEEERRRISQRTKEGLAQVKARGQKLGSPTPWKGGEPNRKRAARFAKKHLPLLQELRAVTDAEGECMSYNKIAREMNTRGVPTSQGGQWHATTVERILNR